MNKIFSAVATFVAAASFAVSASAVTFIDDGDIENISDGDTFFGIVVAEGGAGSWTVQFESAVDLLAGANAALTGFVEGSFSNLEMSWISATSGELGKIDVIDGLLSLSTLFTNPDDLIQSLYLEWSGSENGVSFTVDVSGVVTTPLPAGLLLMLTAIAGLGAVGLRRRKAPAA